MILMKFCCEQTVHEMWIKKKSRFGALSRDISSN